MHDHAGIEGDVGIAGDVVGGDHHLFRTFAGHLPRDLWHRELSVDRLPAGHRHRIVEQDLVGDVVACGDRLPDRQIAGMEVGALAHILENMRRVGEARLPHPVDAFRAHLGKA